MSANPECGRKVGFGSKRSAEDAMRYLARTTGASLDNLNVYRCRGCGRWHVGHLRAGRRR